MAAQGLRRHEAITGLRAVAILWRIGAEHHHLLWKEQIRVVERADFVEKIVRRNRRNPFAHAHIMYVRRICFQSSGAMLTKRRLINS